MTRKTEKKTAETSVKSDEVLMLKYQNGDDEAFAVLYKRHSTKVYGYLRNKIKDADFAEDIFQSVFMKLHKSRSKYDPVMPFLPWLFIICKSVMVDHVRKKQRIKEDLNDSAISLAVAQKYTEPAILPNMTLLPVMQQQALDLRYGHELSFEEIADKLNTSPVNIRQMISRAFKRLRTAHDQGGEK